MKEYAFLSCTEVNLSAPFYGRNFSNGPPPDHKTPHFPITDLQGYINEGWVLVNTHIHCGPGDRDSATYRFILEREIPAVPQSDVKADEP